MSSPKNNKILNYLESSEKKPIEYFDNNKSSKTTIK